MTSNNSNYVDIKSEVYEGVTDCRHFVVEISYEGCKVSFDDIYFDNSPSLLESIKQFCVTRRGEVKMDGGFRFNMKLVSTANGGMKILFYAEPSSFPGRLILEGYFDISGEFVEQTTDSLIALLVDARPLRLCSQ